MVDIVDSKRRSEIMSRIGPRDTKAELAVRSIAHRMGLRFRLHRRDLPGCPDVVFPRSQLAVFVHGCFWHRHQGCSNCTSPKTRADFWQTKFRANVDRDARNLKLLADLGWRTLVIWECETSRQHLVERKLASGVRASRRPRNAVA